MTGRSEWTELISRAVVTATNSFFSVNMIIDISTQQSVMYLHANMNKELAMPIRFVMVVGRRRIDSLSIEDLNIDSSELRSMLEGHISMKIEMEVCWTMQNAIILSVPAILQKRMVIAPSTICFQSWIIPKTSYRESGLNGDQLWVMEASDSLEVRILCSFVTYNYMVRFWVVIYEVRDRSPYLTAALYPLNVTLWVHLSSGPLWLSDRYNFILN